MLRCVSKFTADNQIFFLLVNKNVSVVMSRGHAVHNAATCICVVTLVSKWCLLVLSVSYCLVIYVIELKNVFCSIWRAIVVELLMNSFHVDLHRMTHSKLLPAVVALYVGRIVPQGLQGWLWPISDIIPTSCKLSIAWNLHRIRQIPSRSTINFTGLADMTAPV